MSGGKKKRRDLREGQEQFNQFANQSIAQQQPFTSFAQPALQNLVALGGDGTFQGSQFFGAAENGFRTERDAIDQSLSDQGLLFSSARLNAVEDANQRNFLNGLQLFQQNQGALADVGLNANQNITNTLLAQGNTALGTQGAIADTRQGFLGGLGQVASIGSIFTGSDDEF